MLKLSNLVIVKESPLQFLYTDRSGLLHILITFCYYFIETGKSGRAKKKQAAEHLLEMENQMQVAQEEMKARKEAADKKEAALNKGQEIITAGVTPRRTPARFGL